MDSQKDGATESSGSFVIIEQPNKRRSVVFQRQSIVPNHQDLENTDCTDEVTSQSKKAKLEEESGSCFNLPEYIKKLKQEDKEWRKEYSERKARVQDLLKRDKNQEQLGQDLDLSCLSDSERAFLAAKPDYEEFKRNFVKLQALTTKVCYLNKYAAHLHDQTMLKLQDNTNDAVDRIIKLAD